VKKFIIAEILGFGFDKSQLCVSTIVTVMSVFVIAVVLYLRGVEPGRKSNIRSLYAV